jgi:hypothetical protein
MKISRKDLVVTFALVLAIIFVVFALRALHGPKTEMNDFVYQKF